MSAKKHPVSPLSPTCLTAAIRLQCKKGHNACLPFVIVTCSTLFAAALCAHITGFQSGNESTACLRVPAHTVLLHGVRSQTAK